MSLIPEKPQVLLINPPIYEFALYDLFLKPYGLLRIGRWLEKAGYDVYHLNALDYRDELSLKQLGSPHRRKDGTGKFFRQEIDYPENLVRIPRKFARYGILEESFRNRLKAFGGTPDLVLITSGMTYWYRGVQEAVQTCREIFPSAPIGIGGIYATLMTDHCRNTCRPDFITEGSVWPGIVPELEKRGLPVPNGPPELDVMREDPVWRDSAVLRLNEGCPFHCDYCASNIISPHFSSGEVRQVVDMVKFLYERWGTRNFAFYDDALLINREDVLIPFLEEIIRLKLPLRFYNPNALHIRYLDESILELMMKAGFREIRMGFESSDDSFHEKADGKVNMSTFAEAVDAINRSGFPPGRAAVYILAGLPGQRGEEVEQSIRYAARFGLRCRIAQYSPVPGTALWDESLKTSRLPLAEEPLYHNSTFFSMEWEGFTRDELERLKRLTLELYKGS